MKAKKQEYRKAVFVVVYKKQKNRIIYLILRRKKHWKGWEFPKGGLERGESINSGVRREVYEETGLRIIKIKRFNVFGRYKYRQKFRDRPGYIGQTYQLFAAQVPEGKTRFDSKEHGAFKWLSFEKAMRKIKFENQKRCLRIVNGSLTKI